MGKSNFEKAQFRLGGLWRGAACLALFLSVLFFVPFLDPAFAEDRPLVSLGNLVVTARQSDDQTGDVDIEDATGTVSVIQRKDFEGKMEDLSDVLEKEAGVQIRQSGGLGSLSTVSLRGSTSDQVLVFMDGVLLNDASGGGVDLSNIALSDVAAIEVFQGITPINFEKSSIGGVINIRTLRPKEGLNASVSAGYGSFNTRKADAFVNQKPGKWDYLVSVGYLASDNDFEFVNDNGTSKNPADDRREKRRNAQFDQINALARGGYDVSDTLRLDFLNQLFIKKQGIPKWNNSDQARTELETKRNIATLKLTADDLGPLHLNTSTKVEFSWKQEEYDDRGAHVGLGAQHNRYTTKRWGGDFYAEWLTDMQTLSLMLNYQYETYEPDDLQIYPPWHPANRYDPKESARHYFSSALQEKLYFFGDRLIVAPALRYTRIKDHLQGADSWEDVSADERDRNEGYFSPQIGAKYRLIPEFTLRSNLARYVREPSFFELFGDRGLFIGNSDLQAEKGVNFDVGFDVDCSPSFPGLDRVSGSAAYFISNVEDMITFVYDARGIGKAVNISKARISGVEATLRLDFLQFFRLTGNYTRQDPENRSEIRAFNGKRLPGRYETAYTANLEAGYGGIKVYGEYVVETGMYYDTANLLEAEDKKEFNAGISYWYDPFLFRLEGKNLSDDRYEAFNGYPVPGRAVYFTVTFRYS